MREKIKLEKLSTGKFIYELHSMDNSYRKWENAIGYCDSKDNSILSKLNMMCVMFEDMEDEREKFWIHIPYSLFNSIFEIEEEAPEEIKETLEDFENQFERNMFEYMQREYRAMFYANNGLESMHERNLKEVSDNEDGMRYFVRIKNGDTFWWEYNKEQSELEPKEVKVVNEVGGFHHRDFTAMPKVYDGEKWVDSEYEFTAVRNRRDLPK